jgi:hypothetical protein
VHTSISSFLSIQNMHAMRKHAIDVKLFAHVCLSRQKGRAYCIKKKIHDTGRHRACTHG